MTVTNPPVVDAGPGIPTAGAVLRVVVVNGSPSRRSKTLGLADAVLDTLGKMLPIDVSRVDVYRLGPGFTAATERDDVTPDVEAMLRLAEDADLLIAAAPVYRGSYPGMFKHFFDLVDQYALANTLVLLAATGGGEHHALVLEHAMRPLFAFFQALTVPVAIFASSGDFDGVTLLNPRVHGRIEMALADVLDLLKSRATGTRATADS
ncbi:NAD(P)H-dependent oxidoreductase [Phytoactinopolyspora halotolerans]|uniref:FMN reductase n=1 Tax=Phytoactinopolyspora halotolerans TaxID=1981512 RepID=A0A6L9S7Y7_9ACTN|nr:NAD(P)H-dependent oxidoreductase [Phytoactinopolyspora halotolerans]NEE00811.1 FMN reductase [Phytoactinopolyspora halotolerans]